MADKDLHIFLIAGEPSGDVLGAQLMNGLREEAKVSGYNIRFSGIGGDLMAEEGLSSLFPMSDLAVMGVAEVLPRIPRLLARIQQAATFIRKARPDIVLTIDAPDFCFRVVKKVKEAGGPQPYLVHCVAPTVWAWRPERAAKLASLYDHLLCLFPFEPPYFEKEGLKTTFIGHPMLEKVSAAEDGASFRESYGISHDRMVLGLLFGSRIGELNRMGPILREAALSLAKTHPELLILAPTLPHLKPMARNLLREFPCETKVVTASGEKWAAFKAMDLALATSGTVGLELAVANVPHLICYRMNPITWRLVKNKLTTRFAHLANILLDRAVVPEFIQPNCKPENVTLAAATLLTDQGARDQQRAAFAGVRELLKAADNQPSSRSAAASVLEHFRNR